MIRKRIASALLAAVLLLTSGALASCSNGGTPKEPDKEKRTNVYAGETIQLPEDVSYVNSLSVGSGNAYITYEAEYTAVMNDMGEIVEQTPGYDWEENEERQKTLPEGWWLEYKSEQMLLTVDLETKETVGTLPFSVDEDTYGWAYSFMPGPNGTLVTRSQKYSWDEATETSTNESFILTIDPKTGDVTKVISLNEALTKAGYDMNNVYVNQFLATDDAIYVTLESEAVVLDPDGSFKNKLEMNLGDGWIQGIWQAGARIVFSVYSGGKNTLKILENGQITDLKSETLKQAGSNASPMAADNENLYYNSSTGISAYNFANDTFGEVLNYINSDIENSGNTSFLPDGRIVIASTDWNADKAVSTVAVLHRVPDEELAEEIILRLGCVYVDYNLRRSIFRYNKQNTGIRIALTDYSSYNNEENEWTGAVTQFNNDIAAGKVPDIVLLNTDMPTESYLRKSTFVDLNKLIDGENGLDRSKFLTGIWTASETDGKLNSMILTFSLNTLLAKSEIVGNEPGWTFDDMMKAISTLPEGGRAFYEYSRDEILNNFFMYSMDSFINWETGETYFDTPGFIEFAKYLATCPEKGYWETRYGDNYEYDPERDREFEEEYAMRYARNMALFSMGYYSDFTGYLNTRNEFASKDVTAIGYPRNGEGNGSVIVPNIELAISSKSQAKDQAWEVLKFFLSDQQLLNPGWQFSVSREAMSELRAKAKDNYGDYVSDEESVSWMREEGYSEEYIEYQMNSRQPFDEAGADYVMTLIEGADTIARTDSALVDIVKEELSGVFAGSKAADTAAKQIASRVGIYVAEHK